MAIWLIRAGAHGEYEQKFITENRVYVTWEKLGVDISKLSDRDALVMEMLKLYPDAKPKTLLNWASQVWPFAHEIKKVDLVILPLKTQPAIQIGEIDTPEYHFQPAGPDPFFHWRTVKWIGEAIPRDNFAQDLLNSFGAFLTICRIKRNDAEGRIAKMRENHWKPESIAAAIKASTSGAAEAPDESSANTDLEQAGHDQIAQLIAARFKMHDLTRLVDAILRTQGYTTYVSPKGADGGADILAGNGPLGFGSPRLCVEVKSADTPIGREDVDKLLGAVSKFKADEGLFVSWSGFKQNVFKEMAQTSFFKIRLWTRKELLEALFANYDRLDEDIKAELPLKRIWTVAAQEEE
jgi:restriction system protein